MLLLSEITLPNGRKIKNRMVKSAMGEGLADNHNQPTDELIQLYKRWANGGVGLLISGNVKVDRKHLSSPGNLVIDDDTNLDKLRSLANAGTENNTCFVLQINHPGKQTPKVMTKEPVAPSAIPIMKKLRGAFNTPRALLIEEIQDIIQKFINVGEIAQKAGFSGVQIHAAHGYLINQFLSPVDNQRTDQYGGNLENRMRILIEIYQGLREVTSPDFIIGLKINSSDFTEKGFNREDSYQVILKMAELGIDFVEISGGNYEKSKIIESKNKELFFLEFAKKIQKQVKFPVILTGGLTHTKVMEEVVSSEGIAMVGLGRALVMNPELPNQISTGSCNLVNLPRLSTKIRRFDDKIGSIVGLSYYKQQMRRLAHGKDTKFTTNAWPVLFNAIMRQVQNSFKIK